MTTQAAAFVCNAVCAPDNGKMITLPQSRKNGIPTSRGGGAGVGVAATVTFF